MGNLKSKQATTLNGLYPDCEWTPRSIRAMVQHGRLAPLFVGENEEKRMSINSIEPKHYQEDCPICFLFYRGGLNRTKCCNKGMCTECFLQVKPPERKVPCPFCNQDALFVTFSGPLAHAQITEIEEERLNQEAVSARLLNEARRGSSARQLAPEDLGNAMRDPNAAAEEKVNSQREIKDSGDVDTAAMLVEDAEKSAVSVDDDDDNENGDENDAVVSCNDDNDQDASAPVSIAARVAGEQDGGIAASPRAHFFGSPDHVPAHLDDENLSLMTLEQRMLDEAIRMSLAADANPAQQARSAPASVSSTPASKLTAKKKPRTRSRLSLSVRLSSSADESEKSADSDDEDDVENNVDNDDDEQEQEIQEKNEKEQGKDQEEEEEEKEEEEEEEKEGEKQLQQQLRVLQKHASKKSMKKTSLRLHTRRRSHARSKSTSVSVDESTEGSYSGQGDPARRSTTLSSTPCSSTTSCNMSDPEDDDPPVDRPPKPNMTSSSSSSTPLSKTAKRRRNRKSSSPKKVSLDTPEICKIVDV